MLSICSARRWNGAPDAQQLDHREGNSLLIRSPEDAGKENGPAAKIIRAWVGARNEVADQLRLRRIHFLHGWHCGRPWPWVARAVIPRAAVR